MLAVKIGLPGFRYNQVSKGDIKREIIKHSRVTIKEEVEASRKVGDKTTADLSIEHQTNNFIWKLKRVVSLKKFSFHKKIN